MTSPLPRTTAARRGVRRLSLAEAFAAERAGALLVVARAVLGGGAGCAEAGLPLATEGP